ncbi:magnesium-translocating P-type ATPase [Dactylosporangium sp. NPDC051485]|uniref:magnesium-translocating P-type ATPase n=1 Tax=Dactylosporangium sp. NPDC051485 TaxID=3154846 RepID=UPI0034409BA8
MRTPTRVRAAGRGVRLDGGPLDDRLLDQAGLHAVQRLSHLSGCTPAEALRTLGSDERGLSEAQAAVRLAENGINQLPAGIVPGWGGRLARGLRSPFLLLLLVLDVVMAVAVDPFGVVLISAVVMVGLVLRLRQEGRFDELVASLHNLAAPRVSVLRRSGRGLQDRPRARRLNSRLLVAGDLILLGAGDVVPADCRVVEAENFALNQAVFTGESIPAPRFATGPGGGSDWMAAPPAVAAAQADARVDVLRNATLALTGSSVAAGQATAVVVNTGQDTVLAAVTRRSSAPRRATAADLGLRAVTWLLIRLLCALVPAVFALTALMHRDADWSGAALFAIAVAVGLVPELLPVVLAAVHGRGLSALASARIVVTRPAAVQDLAGMDVLCTDKTGTLTAGTPVLAGWVGPDGDSCPPLLDHAVLYAVFDTEWENPLDAAVLDAVDRLDRDVAEAQYEKVDEFSFDHTRRCGSVLLDRGSGPYLMITKGAVAEVLSRCTRVRIGSEIQTYDGVWRERLAAVCTRLWADGQRLLAIAYREIPETTSNEPDVAWESELTLLGFLVFTDAPKPGLATAIAGLAGQGVRTVVVTGDATEVAVHVCHAAGISPGRPVTGAHLDRLDDSALVGLAAVTTVFAEVNPLQKARVVSALRSGGHVVGYLGDGVNDTPALRAADIGLAAPEAVGVARYAADAILLDKNLAVLHQGVTTARHAALNATKYLKATLSANLGNVLSVLAASAFLPFLPMLPLQILVQNLGYDLVQLTVPTDHADAGQLTQPHRWNTRDLLRFAACFASLSSLFDLVTFWLLRHAWSVTGSGGEALFHTGWFIESLLTQVLAVLVIRTAGLPLVRSRPARPVALAALAGCCLVVALPYTALGGWLGLPQPPAAMLGALLLIVAGYLVTVHAAKIAYQKVFGRWL